MYYLQKQRIVSDIKNSQETDKHIWLHVTGNIYSKVESVAIELQTFLSQMQSFSSKEIGTSYPAIHNLQLYLEMFLHDS